VAVPGAEHRSGPVRAVAQPRQVLRCTADPAHAATSGATSEVGRAIRDRLTFARRLLLGPDRCGACAVILTMPLRATDRALTVLPGNGAPFTVTLELPLARCPDCATENVPSRVVAHVERAAAAAVAVD